MDKDRVKLILLDLIRNDEEIQYAIIEAFNLCKYKEEGPFI